MPAMLTRKCAQCKEEFQARAADVKRGWGKFCSKSCKAIKQENRTGQYAQLQRDRHYRNEFGGTPAYDKYGEYEGFYAPPFSNEGFDDV